MTATDQDLWDLLRAEPGVGVISLCPDGRLLYVNRQAAQLYTGDPDVDWQGRGIRDFFSEGAGKERLEIIDRVVERQEPVVLRHIRRGRQLQATFWPVHEALNGETKELDEDESAILVITREGEAPLPDGEDFEIVESSFADFGPLNILSRRELEVLALLGQGLSISKIAEHLHRSVKTIEKHRHSIGKKLHASNRVELAKLAHIAGLRVEDAGLEREAGTPPQARE
jgi:DNA-binding NarL/FixJ family response regulator